MAEKSCDPAPPSPPISSMQQSSGPLHTGPDTDGWYSRLSNMWCSMVSTLRSTGSPRHIHSKSTSEASVENMKESPNPQRASRPRSSSEVSKTWSYRKGYNRKADRTTSDPIYYNLIEDFPYGVNSIRSLDCRDIEMNEHGGSQRRRNGCNETSGIIVGEDFSEEEIYINGQQWESIIPIEVLLIIDIFAH